MSDKGTCCICSDLISIEHSKREVAQKGIWGDDSYSNGRSMDVFISKLRKYLKDDSKVEIISVQGKGFKLVVG